MVGWGVLMSIASEFIPGNGVVDVVDIGRLHQAVTFTRGTTATYYGHGGLKTAAVNAPRFCYDPLGNYLGLMVEPDSTNLITYSDTTISQVAGSGITAAAAAISPFFTNSIQFPAGSGNSNYAYKAYAFAANTTYTVSMFVVMADGAAPVLSGGNGTGDMTLVIATNPATVNLTVTQIWGPLYRISATDTTAASPSFYCGVVSYAGQSQKAFAVTGYQLEQGAYCSSYIPTTTAAVTRNAENCSVANLALVGYNPSAVTLYLESIPLYASSTSLGWISLMAATNSNIYATLYASPVAMRSGGGTVAPPLSNLSIGTYPHLQAISRLIYGYSTTARAGAVDGAAGVSQAGNYTMPEVNTLLFGGSLTSGTIAGPQYIRKISIYNKLLDLVTMRRLTSPVPQLTYLFTNGEPGLIYDVSNMGTLYQDPAGTIPVYDVEQPVGFMRDVSGNGNHFTASDATTARPIYSARYNQFISTEVVTTAAPWNCSAADFSLNNDAITPPAGYTHSTQLTAKGTTGVASISCGTVPPGVPQLNISMVVNIGNMASLNFMLRNSTTATNITGSAGTLSAGGSFTGSAYTTVNLGGGWYQINLTWVNSGDYVAGNNLVFYYGATSGLASGLYWSVTGASLQWGTDLKPYQQVTSAKVYNTVGFLPYLQFNGTARGTTPSINFSSTNKMTVFAGLSAMSTANQAIFILGVYAGAGTYEFATGELVANGLVISRASPSTVYRYETPSPAAYRTMVVTATMDGSISTLGGGATLRVNGVTATAVNGGQLVTLSAFSNAVGYIGSSSVGARLFIGRMHCLVVRGAATLTQDIPSGETWVNGRTHDY
jgi:hypothetical protein